MRYIGIPHAQQLMLMSWAKENECTGSFICGRTQQAAASRSAVSRKCTPSARSRVSFLMVLRRVVDCGRRNDVRDSL